MDTNAHEMSTSIGSEDATSLASYYDNADSGRTSSSFEEQSDESESDPELDDHEADIDKMLMDLEGFQVVRYLSCSSIIITFPHVQFLFDVGTDPT